MALIPSNTKIFQYDNLFKFELNLMLKQRIFICKTPIRKKVIDIIIPKFEIKSACFILFFLSLFPFIIKEFLIFLLSKCGFSFANFLLVSYHCFAKFV